MYYRENGRYPWGGYMEEGRSRRGGGWYEKGGKRPREEQTHVHELEGSTKLAEFDEDVHNHRFAGVSGEKICVPGGHIHKVYARTDFFDHFHFVIRSTGLQIPVGKGKHVHFASGNTTFNDGHKHEFQFATLIESPMLPEPKEQFCNYR